MACVTKTLAASTGAGKARQRSQTTGEGLLSSPVSKALPQPSEECSTRLRLGTDASTTTTSTTRTLQERSTRHRLGTDVSLGPQPGLDLTRSEDFSRQFSPELEPGVRHRFRTNSSLGLPVSPWGTYDGAQPYMQPFMQPTQQDMFAYMYPQAAYGMGLSNMYSGWYAYPGAPLEGADVEPGHGAGTSPAPTTKEATQLSLSSALDLAVKEAPLMTPTTTMSSGPAGKTTVMLRNLPVGFTRQALLDFLDAQGFASKYDFAYLPVSFETMTGLSHAFVNMVSPEDADALREALEGFTAWPTGMKSEAACQVVWNDKHQGLAALVERYRNSPVMHGDIPEECKPILLDEHGKVQPLPAPTQKLKPPKMGKSRI